jgi:integrase
MPRPATGQVVVDQRRRSPTYGLRFHAYGRREYVALGTAADGWTRAKAHTELQNVLADIRREIWRPPAVATTPVMSQDPTFHEFASQWFESSKGEWREKTRLDYEWQLSNHLLPFFKDHRLSQITIAEVDRYRQGQGGRSPSDPKCRGQRQITNRHVHGQERPRAQAITPRPVGHLHQ